MVDAVGFADFFSRREYENSLDNFVILYPILNGAQSNGKSVVSIHKKKNKYIHRRINKYIKII